MLASSVRPADRIDDEVDATPVGEPQHLAGHVGRGVVDAVVQAVARASRPRRSSLDAVASTVAPAALASWMAARPTPPAPAWTSTVSPARRWPNSNRQSSAVPYSIGTPAACSRERPSGTAQVAAGRHAHQLGVRAVAHAWPRRAGRRAKPSTPVADLADDAGGLVADDVRRGGQDAALAVEQVAALHADGGHVDEERRRAGAAGLGHLLVAEHLGPAGLVVHRSLHGRRTYRLGPAIDGRRDQRSGGLPIADGRRVGR